MSERQLLTNSRAKTARSCAKKHHLMFTEGLRPVTDASALRFGTLIHLGLEAWWKSAQAGIGGEELLAVMLTAVAGEADPFDRARAEELLRGYHYRWESAIPDFEILAVEVQFRTRLVNPSTRRPSPLWDLGGKIDAIVRDRRDGLTKIVEHKTSSEDIRDGSEYWRRLRMDSQVTAYYAGAASLGHDVGGCVYDVIKKPGLHPKDIPQVDADGLKIVFDANGERVRTKTGKWRETASTEDGYVLQVRPESANEFRVRVNAAIAAAPNDFYARGPVVRLEAEMKRGLKGLWLLAQQIHEGDLIEEWPENPDACVSFGRSCPFFDLCTGAASIDDATRFRRSATVHPELQEVANAGAA
jgi:hypothetical protein